MVLGQLMGMAGERMCAQATDKQEEYKTITHKM